MNWVRFGKQPDERERYIESPRASLLCITNESLAADAFVAANDITSEMQYRTLAVRY